tara:strand:- start:514 stop:810 length:297 start_codon:yes stop_codon:yes gene_type:complete
MATKKDTREALAEPVYRIVEEKMGAEATAKLYRIKGVKSNMLYTEYLVKDYSQDSKKQEIQKAIKRVIDLNNGSNCIAFTKSDGKPALIRINGANVNS